MKKILLILLFSISLMSYGKTINFDQLQNKNGIYYEINKETPYTGTVISYYETGQIKLKRNYKNGKKDGEWIFYDENGEIDRRKNYKIGDLLVKGYNYNPDYDNPIDYSMLRLNYGRIGEIEVEKTGKTESPFYGEDQIYSEGNYKNEKKEGEWIFYDSNNKIAAKGSYKEGEPFGEWIKYDYNGDIEYKENFENISLEKKSINPNQLQDKDETNYEEIENLYTGESITYYESGEIKSKASYKNGKLDGEAITYYKNGEIEYKGNYKDGILDRGSIIQYENQKIEEKANFKDKKLNEKLMRKIMLSIFLIFGLFIGYHSIRIKSKIIKAVIKGEDKKHWKKILFLKKSNVINNENDYLKFVEEVRYRHVIYRKEVTEEVFLDIFLNITKECSEKNKGKLLKDFITSKLEKNIKEWKKFEKDLF
ncbi:MAG: hypothetical protein WBG30_11160 [Psychrilyobacter sp.]|uniref:toxin-antitoxin system YwqK family antitoxin n=1 Tax=Psychrilyobacter sp. TaxID=2586924 RepID=UPI003C74FD6B